MMKTHFSEADLLETYYMQPGESMPVMMHLASCTECAARYERLERKLREAAACHDREAGDVLDAGSGSRSCESVAEQPRAVAASRAGGARRRRGRPRLRPRRRDRVHDRRRRTSVAVASRARRPLQPATGRSKTTAGRADDPWQSEELQDFHAVVQWESWVAESQRRRHSL